MVKSDGGVSVTDTCLGAYMREITQAGRMLIPGNWQYQSQEVLLVTTNANDAADVYSWGATVYEVRYSEPCSLCLCRAESGEHYRYSRVGVLTMASMITVES